MEELLDFIVNFSFPVVIAVYLLIRMEKKIETLSDSITNLALIIEKKFL